jgi:hypothetical protein
LILLLALGMIQSLRKQEEEEEEEVHSKRIEA